MPSGGRVKYSKGTLSGNSATVAGSGIYNAGTVTVRDTSTICGNSAPAGFDTDVYNLGVLYKDGTSMICKLDGNHALPI